MAPPADLREWIALLERSGELVRVEAEVDPHLEVTEIVDRTVRAGRPGAALRAAEGKPAAAARQPVRHRAAHVPRLRRRPARRRRRRSSQTCSRCSRRQGLADKLRGLRQLKSIADSRPSTVRRGACQEIVLRGDEVDLGLLPVQTCWPGDAAPFITLPAVITRRPADRRYGTSACTGCRCSARARPRCTGSCTRTAAPTTSSPRGGWRSPSRSGSTRSPPTARARRCRSTSTS